MTVAGPLRTEEAAAAGGRKESGLSRSVAESLGGRCFVGSPRQGDGSHRFMEPAPFVSIEKTAFRNRNYVVEKKIPGRRVDFTYLLSGLRVTSNQTPILVTA